MRCGELGAGRRVESFLYLVEERDANGQGCPRDGE